MIVLGIAPGLGALAYSVLEVEDGELEALDSDVLHAGRRLDVASALQIAKRCHAHHLVLDVVLRRHPPAIVAIGPAVDRKEQEDHVTAVRLLLRAIANGLTVPCYDFRGRSDLIRVLDASSKGLSGAVENRLPGAPGIRDRRIVLAMGAALAALKEWDAGCFT